MVKLVIGFAFGWLLRSPTSRKNTVTGCYGCSSSIHVSVAATTHVIIDVMGYYEEATGFATGAVTPFFGPPRTIAAYSWDWFWGGTCPTGTVLIAGGTTNNGNGNVLIADSGYNGTGWVVRVQNNEANATDVFTFSLCMDVR